MMNFRLLPILLLAACSTQSALDRSRDHARLGDHVRAFQVLDELRAQQQAEGGEVDAELEEAHAAAKLMFLRQRALLLIFQEREDDALADLLELETLDPTYPGIEALRQRAYHKKALRLVGVGDSHLLRKELAPALACYLESESIWPGLEETKEGIENVRAAMSRLTVRAQQQFLEAVRKLPEFRYIEVQWHAANSLHNAPARDDAVVVQEKARRENAVQAAARGRDCESRQQFGAALIEYREAHRLDPTLPEIQTSIKLMEREVKAATFADKAQKEMRAGRFDIAREHLAAAFELSVLMRNDIGALVIETRRLEGEQRYREARDLEVLGKKSEALAAFEALLKEWPDGVSDAQARIDALRIDIEGVQKSWAEAEAAEAAGDLPKALDHYIDAERFYPGWKDGKDRIARLREAINRQGGGSGNGPGK